MRDEHLSARYDLSPLRTEPRLRIAADRGSGTFAVEVTEGRQTCALRVTALGEGENAWDSRRPAGTDMLLVPRDGAPPSAGILLSGLNAIRSVPVRCPAAASENFFSCETQGPGEVWHRRGGRINAR